MNVKIWAYLGIVIAVLGFSRWAYLAVYDAGFNAAVVQQKELIQDAREQATEDARIKWQKLVDEAAGQIVVEERIVEVIREVEVEIPVVVETVRTECRVLPDTVIGLLNQQVRAGSGGEGGSTDIPPVPD